MQDPWRVGGQARLWLRHICFGDYKERLTIQQSAGKKGTWGDLLNGWAAGELLRALLWPGLGSGASVVIGWIEGFPWFHLYVSAIVSFAAISTGMLQFSKWRYRNRVEDKLVFSAVRVGPNILGADKLGSLRFGIALSNKALFPIEFEVKRVITSFGDCHPPKKDYKKTIFTIPIDGNGWFDDHDIPVDRAVNGPEEGLIEYELSYGRPGRRTFELKQKKRIHFAVSNEGKIMAINWVDEG